MTIHAVNGCMGECLLYMYIHVVSAFINRMNVHGLRISMQLMAVRADACIPFIFK